MRPTSLIVTAAVVGLTAGSPFNNALPMSLVQPVHQVSDNSTAASLDKRLDCSGNPLYCPAFGVWCPAGTACCSALSCCNAGYACYTDGSCRLEVISTYCSTALVAYTSTVTSVVYTTVTSTWFSTTTDYTTITQTRQTGVATNTQWVTVTTVVKRDVPEETGTAAVTGVAPIPAPTSGPRYIMRGDSPAFLFRWTLESWGIVGKRTLYTTITVVASTTSYRYNYATSYYTAWITSKTGVLLTSTSVVFNGASSTVTVTSTSTITSQSSPPAPPVTPPTTQPMPTETTAQPTTQTSQGSDPARTAPQASTTSEPPASTTLTMAPTFVVSGTSTPTLIATTATSSGVALVFYTTAPQPHRGLSVAARAGIGVGAAVGAILLLGGLGFLIWRWRKKSVDDAVSRAAAAAGTATPATTTARDSDFYSGRGMSRTPVSYAGFEEKVVSPHASMAGSPPVVTAYPVPPPSPSNRPPPAHVSEVSATGIPQAGYYAPAAGWDGSAGGAARRHQSWTSSSGYGTAVGGPGSPVYEGGGYQIHETGGYAVHEAGDGGMRQHLSHFSEELPAEAGYGYEHRGHDGQGQAQAQEFDAGRRHLSGEMPADDGPGGWRPPYRG